MEKGNIAVKQWLRNKSRFADLFNGIVFQGEQVVLPEDLEETDSESSVIMEDSVQKEKGVQRYRDIVMRWNRGIDLAILACENQEKVHYAMPVRAMVYDGLTYTDQIRQLWRTRDESLKVTEEEFLSKFRKEDKIFPVISLVFYYGSESWDGSEDLYGMLYQGEEIRKQEILKSFIPNYHINLIDAGKIENVERFQTDLQVVLGMLKYRKRKLELRKYVNNHKDFFENVELETYQALRALLHSEKVLKGLVSRENKKEAVNMCEALEEWGRDERQAGMEEGIKEGIKEGVKALVNTCKEFGVTKEETLKRILKNFELTLEVAEAYLGEFWG